MVATPESAEMSAWLHSCEKLAGMSDRFEDLAEVVGKGIGGRLRDAISKFAAAWKQLVVVGGFRLRQDLVYPHPNINAFFERIVCIIKLPLQSKLVDLP